MGIYYVGKMDDTYKTHSWSSADDFFSSRISIGSGPRYGGLFVTKEFVDERLIFQECVPCFKDIGERQ